VISGSGFNIRIGTTVYEPIPVDKLRKLVVDGSFHFSTMKRLSGLVMTDLSEITSMRKLQEAVKQANVSAEVRDEIRREVVHLQFPQDYWSINASTLHRAFELLKGEPAAFRDDDPLHPSCFLVEDRVTQVFGGFGYMAPSFLIPSCPEIKLGKSSEPHSLVVRSRPILQAITDWKNVVSNGTITNNPRNLSSKYNDRALRGRDKARIWSDLQSIVGPKPTSSAVTVTEVGTVSEKDVASLLDF
jgi:hypothetical protein